MTLKLLLPPSGTPMNITIFNDPISSIPDISQVPSTSLITDQFPMDACHDIYVVAFEDEGGGITTTSSRILR